MKYPIGPLIKDLREEAGLTQTELAKRAGLSTPSFVDYEKGLTQPSKTILKKIAKCCDFDPELALEYLIATKNVSHDGFDQVLERIKSILSLQSEEDVAEELDITPTHLLETRLRGKFPHHWAKQISRKYNISLEYILTGEEVDVIETKVSFTEWNEKLYNILENGTDEEVERVLREIKSVE
ncbi:MAG: helix-turn-helix domain-containing protein, partial [Nitrospinales bacterium]